MNKSQKDLNIEVLNELERNPNILDREKLPYMVPKQWIKPSEAMAVSYSRKFIKAIDFYKVDINFAMVEFSHSNIKNREKHEKF